MKIGFNPAIKNQNIYSTKRNASEHTSISNNQLAFKKVNQKYYDMAEKMYKNRGNVTSEWFEWLMDDVILWKSISKQDAIDTMNAVREFISIKSLDAFKEDLIFFKNL
ncbi:MAG: hypothetical protein Q4E83_03410 [bacterium]|nr:hypothetical protein [bacterium]